MTAPYPRILCLAIGPLGILPNLQGKDLDYEADILPILMAKCADCHSAREGVSKGGLKFDDLEHFRRNFGEDKSWVVPGNWDASQLFLTVFRPSADKSAMPPKGKGERLDLDEVKRVMQWIAEGAAVQGERGPRGAMPERIEDLFLDLPPDLAETLKRELAVKSGAPTTTAPAPASAAAAPAPPKEEAWTNREGRSIRATLLRVEGETAVLRLPDGREVTYPLANLAEESRTRARRAGGSMK